VTFQSNRIKNYNINNNNRTFSTLFQLDDDEANATPIETTFIPKRKRLTEQTMSQSLRTMEYAVRGQVVIAADRINEALKDKNAQSNYPFDHIVYTNIGNPHGVGQLPLTWPRQVMALSDLPDDVGIKSKFVKKMFPKDAIERAEKIKQALGGHGTGAYTHSQGPDMFRKEICSFIEERDGMEMGSAIPDTIFMTNGASSAIEMVLNALIADSSW
jgi:aspartate/methionine/tyrosine aminotransferase